jgi:arsenate reductase
MKPRAPKLLFLCQANSARSQLAEALAREMFGAEARSAGSKPSGYIHPWAREVMREMGIDISTQSSKSLREIPEEFLQSLDCVITLCSDDACPDVRTTAERVHWPLRDPAGDPEESKLDTFQRTRDEIQTLLKAFGESRGWKDAQ